jgi:hypothetical protein
MTSTASGEQETVRVRQPGSRSERTQLHNACHDVLSFLIDRNPAFGMEFA